MNKIKFLTLVLLFLLNTTGLTQESFTTLREATGVVLPEHSVTLAAKIMGQIIELPVEEGMIVKKDQLLIRLDDTELQADRASAEASRELAQVELEHKQKSEARAHKLAKSQSLSQDKIDDAIYGRAEAGARLRVAEASVAKNLALLKETEIQAPFAGVITKKSAELGQLTQPGEQLLVLEDQSQLKLRAQVKEQDIPHIGIGQSVTVTIDALTGIELRANVNKIIPSGDPDTHAFVIEILLPAHDKIFPGMFGRVRFNS